MGTDGMLRVGRWCRGGGCVIADDGAALGRRDTDGDDRSTGRDVGPADELDDDHVDHHDDDHHRATGPDHSTGDVPSE